MPSPAGGDVRLDPHPTLPATAWLTFSHAAKRNALDVAMWQALARLMAGPEVGALRVLIVRGTGGHFVSGGDIEEFQRFRFEPATLRAFHEGVVAPALAALTACDAVLVAQIEGACIGGGLEIAAGCDLRVCGRSSRLGAPVARLGFPMAPDELLGVARALGVDVAARVLLEGSLLDADEAHAAGVVHRVVDDAQVAAEAEAMAARVLRGAPAAVRIHKQILRRVAQGAAAFTEAERARWAAYADGADHREGIAAFLGKRAPVFQGA